MTLFLSFLALIINYILSIEKEKLMETPRIVNTKLNPSFKYNVPDINLTYELVKPIRIKKLNNNKILYDFGAVNFGTLQVDTRKSSKFSFTILEKYPYIFTEMGKRSFGHYVLNNQVISKKSILPIPPRHLPKIEELPLDIQGVVPFRYVIVQTDLNTSEYNLTQIAIRYPFTNDVSMDSSNENLNKVFQLTKHTIKATTFSGYFIDGERERKPYEADGYLGQLSQYALNSDNIVARKTQLYLLENATWPLEWQMHLIAMAKEDYQRTQDITYITAIYEELKKRLFLDNINKSTGLLNANKLILNKTKLKSIIDWPPIEREGFATTYEFTYQDYLELTVRKLHKTLYDIYGFKKLAWSREISVYLQYIKMHKVPTNNFVNQAHLYNALRNMQFIAKEIENHEDASMFQKHADLLKKTLNNSFFNKELGLYCDTYECKNISFHSNLFAMSFNLVEEDKKEHILEFIYDNRNKASTYTSFYLLKVFFSSQMNIEALDFITKNDNRSWVNMVNNYNATNTMESWNPSIKPNLDHTHIWSSHPLYFIVRYIIGIQEPSKNEIIIKPQFVKLSYLRGKINILNGNLKYTYKSDNNKISYQITKDFDTKIKFIFMDLQNIKNATLNGESIKHISKSMYIADNNFTITVQY